MEPVTLRTLTQVLNSPELPQPPAAHLVAVPQWTQWNLPDREDQFDSRMFLLPGNPEVTGGGRLSAAPGSVREPWPHDNKEEL